MSASPSSRSQVPDRGISLAPFKHVEDERRFEKLPSVIPDSQATPNEYLSQIPVKRFSVPKEEVSLSNPSEGFSFGERQPHRPGQFSQRPQVEHSQSNEYPKFFPGSVRPFPHISPPNRPRPPDVQVPHISPPSRPRSPGPQGTRPLPLDLPEIGLVGRQSSPEAPPPSSGRDITDSPGQHDHFPRSSGIGSQKGTPLKSVASPAITYAESPKPGVRATAPLATMHAQSPGTKAFSSSPHHVETSKQVEVSRQTEEEDQPVLVPASYHERRFEHLKLPLPHIARSGPVQYHASPGSICGDLEGPTPQSSRTARRNRTSRRHRLGQQPTRSDHRESERDYDRPNSRTSNISRKRSFRRHVRPQPSIAPDRKKLAMQNVAQHWNECIQISEAERIEAVQEIARLEDEVHCAEEALENSKQIVAEKEAAIQELTDLYETRKEEGSLAEKETQRLVNEVESLRSDLAKSHEEKTSFHEKYRKNKNKLNEAIQEQQDLFIRARKLYNEIVELQKEKEKRAVDVEAVEAALEDSRKKREELRSCVEQYRAETEQETQKKNHAIDKLKSKIEYQQQELARERSAASELQSKLKTESTLIDMVKNMHSDICSLKENNDSHNEWSRRQDTMTDSLSEKLGRMSDDIKSLTEGRIINDDISSMLQNLETNITNRLASEIYNVISLQTKTEKTAACFQETVQNHFEKLHDNMVERQRAQSQYRQWHEEAHQVVVEHLGNMSADVLETRQSCEELKNNWADFATSDSVWKASFKENFRNEVINQLKDRESKIDKLEETVHRVSHEWAQKLDIMKSSVTDNHEHAKEDLQRAFREIKETLEKRIQEGKVVFHEDISKSEALRDMIEAHLQQVRLQLEAASSNEPETQLLREALSEERTRTSALKKEVANLQSDVGTSNEICQRERQDLNAMGTLKRQLEAISEQVPHVENLNTTFNKMIDLNQVLQSTALYLSKEHNWVKGQLGAKTQSSEIGTESAHFQEQRHEELDIGFQTRDTTVEQSTSLNGLSTINVHVQGDRYRRKVVVTSPALEASLPAPPPSVAQEQQRRRESNVPRPILRSTTASAQDAELVRAAVNHDQYNRPVMARASSAAGGANPFIVEQIRSGLIPRKPRDQGWDFPTLEDFTRESTLGGKNEVKQKPKRNITPGDGANDAPHAMKKTKTEN
ncbi:hypothetical protein NW768_001317 [Fusarium equiseti]|uniref:Myosin heavy chain n=1 Tax=Fusarium equiseti TaxID=61235 RepID=A0ABQ8RPV1_FUSEQ|nr:hypothetical protein NW768_001317 [Fusarium equiseti]